MKPTSNQRACEQKLFPWCSGNLANLTSLADLPMLHSNGECIIWDHVSGPPTFNYKKERRVLCHCLRKVSSWILPSPPSSTMSTEKLDSPASPAYSDAEKGVLESLPVQVSYYPRDKKDADVKQAPIPAAKPKPAKKRVSKWVLWRIWFNTYRYCLLSLSSLSLNPLQEVLHLRVQFEHDWNRFSDFGTLSLCCQEFRSYGPWKFEFRHCK